jgi:Spy/CpxP family protein refolding chaperone
MKLVRIATLAAALCVGMTTVGGAQSTEPQQGQGEGRRGRGEWLLKDINLSGAQKDQIKTIREKYVPQQMELRKAAQATGSMDDATRAKMMDLQEKQAAEIRAILTADQQATFDKNLAAAKERMAARRNGSS